MYQLLYHVYHLCVQFVYFGFKLLWEGQDHDKNSLNRLCINYVEQCHVCVIL